MMFEQGAASDVARAVEDAKLALAAGFTLPETVVPFGTKVIDSGQGLYRESEQAFDAMENVDDVLDHLGPERDHCLWEGEACGERKLGILHGASDIARGPLFEHHSILLPCGFGADVRLTRWGLATFGRGSPCL
jgi:hypothetical protein